MLSVIYITFIVTGKTIGTQYISLFTMSKRLCKYPFEEIVKNFMIFECRGCKLRAVSLWFLKFPVRQTLNRWLGKHWSQLGVILTILQVIKIRIFTEHHGLPDIWPANCKIQTHSHSVTWIFCLLSSPLGGEYVAVYSNLFFSGRGEVGKLRDLGGNLAFHPPVISFQ